MTKLELCCFTLKWFLRHSKPGTRIRDWLFPNNEHVFRPQSFGHLIALVLMPPNKLEMLTYQEFFMTVSYLKCVSLFTKWWVSCLKHEYCFWEARYSQIYFAFPYCFPPLRSAANLGQLPALPWHCLVIRNLIKTHYLSYENASWMR